MTCESVIDSSASVGPGRIDRCVQALANQSRSFVTGLFDHDCVYLNGRLHENPGTMLQVGDRVTVRYETHRRYSPRPRPRRTHRGFTVVYEDRDVIVVDKAHELLTVPTERQEPHTLISRISEYIRREQSGRGAFVVHRLDKGVSGLLVFARNQDIASRLQRQFAEHKPERRYQAIVVGNLPQESGEFRSYLATGKSLTRYSTRDVRAGELAVTRFQTLHRTAAFTSVSVQLETGRRNQIRVHFAEAGHPVLGDPRYAPELAISSEWPWKRLALHAVTLAFDHPVTEERLRFESAVPAEMVRLIRTAGSDSTESRRQAVAASQPETRPARRSGSGRSKGRKRPWKGAE